MSKEKNFPQGFKFGDLVCWFESADFGECWKGCGIVVNPGSWNYNMSRGNPKELLWIVWNDGSKSVHLPGHMQVIAEAENATRK